MAELENRKHERFCQEYVIDLNGTQAAIRAGYSKKTARVQGSQLLTNLNILARVRELQQERAARIVLSQDYVVVEIVETIQMCKEGTPVLMRNPKTGKYEEVGKYQFDSHGALKGLELLGRHLGMFEKGHKPESKENNLLEQIVTSSQEDINTDDLPEVK